MNNNTWDDVLRTLTTSLLKKKCDESVQRKWLRETVATAGLPPTIPWDHLDPQHCAAAFERAPPRTAESYMTHLTDTWCALVATAIDDVEEEEKKEEECSSKRRRLVAWLLCRVDPPRVGMLARASFVGLLVQLAERRAADADWIVAEVASHMRRRSRDDASSSSAATRHSSGSEKKKNTEEAEEQWTTIRIERRTNTDGSTSTTTRTTTAATVEVLQCPCCRGRVRRGDAAQFMRSLVVAAMEQQHRHKWSPGGAALLRAAHQVWPAQTTAELAALSAMHHGAPLLPSPAETAAAAAAAATWPTIRQRRRRIWCGVCE